MIAPGADARRVAARLALVDFPGTVPDARLERLLAAGVRGVVLFRKNVETAPQVAALTAALRAVAAAAGAPAPWVAIDHEGGTVNRFVAMPADPTRPARPPRRGAGAAGAGAGASGAIAPPPEAAAPYAVTALPSAMALGAAGDPALARAAGGVAGRELRALGIHVDFAPVLDVNSHPANPVIGTRAFGDDPAAVSRLGLAFAEGLAAEGVAPVVKHFPGHGDTHLDSHLALPRVDHDRRRLEAVELAPFAAAVQAGVPGVMTAHVVVPALDLSGAPATMSAAMLTGLLRTTMGYDGVICSDSLRMRAIADHYGIAEAAAAAVAAGCDVLLVLGPAAMQDEVLDRLAVAVERGEIAAGRIADALARLDRLGERWVASPSPRRVADPAEVVGIPEHHALAKTVAEAAVTLVTRRAGVVPLRRPVAVVEDAADLPLPPGLSLVAALRHAGVSARSARLDEVLAPGGVGDSEAVVVLTCSRGAPSAAQADAVRRLAARAGSGLVVVATGDPYDVARFAGAGACIATYGPDPYTLDAAARVLAGGLVPRGRLPVCLEAVA